MISSRDLFPHERKGAGLPWHVIVATRTCPGLLLEDDVDALIDDNPVPVDLDAVQAAAGCYAPEDHAFLREHQRGNAH